MTLTVEAPARSWIDICPLDRLILDRGVAAKVGPDQVAVFRVGCDGSDDLYALANYDPFSMANVLSRGIVGCKDGRLKVASPVYKQSFDLTTGECIDDPSVCVPTFDVRVLDGHVQVALPT